MMNPDEYDFFRPLPKEPTTSNLTSNVAINLLRGLEDRSVNHLRRNLKAREDREVFAEDELVRKKSYVEMQCETPGQPRSTFLMVFSPDGSKVASTHGNHNIYVTDIKSGKNIRTLVGHPRTPWCIAFHPTSNQIVASGCLGGEVRIWDLSGGSEVWTAGNQSVIASIAFHPNDRVLVIATYNELYFWDWSLPEPFVQVATANPKEKIRYVAFDKLGHKLITGIANSPHARWERVRAPVPVPRQAERSASPYRMRITPGIVTTITPGFVSRSPPAYSMAMQDSPSTSEGVRDSMSSVPERERRITASYKNLLREYELLVQRYLTVYRPRTMIDRGTDPMPTTNSTTTKAPESDAAAGPSTSQEPQEPQPSTSSSPSTRSFSSSLVLPSRILAIATRRQQGMGNTADRTTSGMSTQTNPEVATPATTTTAATTTEEETTPVSNSDDTAPPQEKRTKCDDGNLPTSESGTQTLRNSGEQQPTTVEVGSGVKSPGVSITCSKKRKVPSPPGDPQQPSTSGGGPAEDLLSDINPITEEVRNRFLPIIKSLPAADRPKLIKRFEDSRAHERLKFRQQGPTVTRKINRRVVIDSSSDSSSSDDETASNAQMRQNETGAPANNDGAAASAGPSNAENLLAASSLASAANPTTNNNPGVRNFILELEQLLMTVLLREIDGGGGTTPSLPPSNDAGSIAGNPDDQQPGPSNLRSSPVYLASGIRDQDQVIRPVVTPGASIFRRFMQRHDPEAALPPIEDNTLARDRANLANSSSRTTIYRSYPRRRLISPAASAFNRISAFMPTRVNYTRLSNRYRRGGSSLRSMVRDDYLDSIRSGGTAAAAAGHNHEGGSTDNAVQSVTASLGNMYSNIVQELESSLNEVRNMRASNRPGETSDMLSSFSESLENIMSQSDAILRNLGGSMSMLPGYGEQQQQQTSGGEPRASFNDPNFYVRDARDEASTTSNLDLSSSSNNVVEGDHNYPRSQAAREGSVSPLMTSLHITISYIQRQARMLRQQVESIERIDRAMFEVGQLQLVRQLVTELLRYVRSQASNTGTGMSSVRQMMAGTRISDSSPYDDSQSEEITSRSSRISSAPLPPGTVLMPPMAAAPVPPPSHAQPSTSSGGSTASEPTRRTSGRKTYPPSRLFRMQQQRHNRRSLLMQCFPRRYSATRMEQRSMPQIRTGSGRSGLSRADIGNPLRHLSSYSLINSSSLNMMARRLEHLLTEQTRLITRPHQEGGHPSTASSRSSSVLGERILSIRLNDCVLRMNRILGSDVNRFRNCDSVVVTQDGASRFGARHLLSLIVDGISKHMEELSGNNGNLSQIMRVQMYSVLAMALLLSDLLLLQLVDSIPPPAGMNLDVERESLTSRIDQMCGQMLQDRFSGHSLQLTRSLHQMRLTMRHAYRTLGQTYNARRNAILPTRQDTNRRRQLITRYLRSIRRRPGAMDDAGDVTRTGDDPPRDSPTPEPPGGGAERDGNSAFNETTGPTERESHIPGDWIMRYAYHTDEEEEINLSSSSSSNQNVGMGGNGSDGLGAGRTQDVGANRDRDWDRERDLRERERERNRQMLIESVPITHSHVGVSNIEESEEMFDYLLSGNSHRSNLYRTNNVNLLEGSDSSNSNNNSNNNNNNGGGGGGTDEGSSQRPWNVPSVQVNDVPISEQPSFFRQRILSHRQRLAERVSEFRYFPQMSVLRPRFLHPLYAGVNPFDADLDDPQRGESTYDCDMITTVTPNHRIQMWDISSGVIPSITNPMKNVIVAECKIHNDASVDIAKDGTILVTLLPSGGYLNVTNRLGVYSLKWETLGQCLYTTSFEQNAVSVSLSPLGRHLVVGLASRRVSIVPSERWTMARIFIIDQKNLPGDNRLPVLRELGQNNRDTRATSYKSVNCIRWLPTSGQGMIYATNTGQLVILT